MSVRKPRFDGILRHAGGTPAASRSEWVVRAVCFVIATALSVCTSKVAWTHGANPVNVFLDGKNQLYVGPTFDAGPLVQFEGAIFTDLPGIGVLSPGNQFPNGSELTREAAAWHQGDWNGAPGGRIGLPPSGDGVFDQLDLVALLRHGSYGSGSYVASRRPIESIPEPHAVALLRIGLATIASARTAYSRAVRRPADEILPAAEIREPNALASGARPESAVHPKRVRLRN